MFPPVGLNPNQMPPFPPQDWSWQRAKQALLAQGRQPGQNLLPVQLGGLKQAQLPTNLYQPSRADSPAPPMVEQRATPRKKG